VVAGSSIKEIYVARATTTWRCFYCFKQSKSIGSKLVQPGIPGWPECVLPDFFS
jgi:hypothetical protein